MIKHVEKGHDTCMTDRRLHMVPVTFENPLRPLHEDNQVAAKRKKRVTGFYSYEQHKRLSRSHDFTTSLFIQSHEHPS